MNKNKFWIFFLVSGLLMVSGSSIIHHYMDVSDGLYGFITGLGLGLMIVGFIRKNKTIHQGH